jgi:hypothetical protein
MKKLLETLDGCLYVKVYSKYNTRDCHISLTDGGNHTIHIHFSGRFRSLGAAGKTCVVTPHRPANGTKFTRISLNGKCGWKNSPKAGTITAPYHQ